MRKMLSGYHYEIDNLTEIQWDKAVGLFDDANIYQTWAYEAVKHGEKCMSHFVLKKDGRVIALAQLRLAMIPIVKKGVAYVRWGPIWGLSGESRNPEIFQQAIRGMRNEYVHHRGLALRLRPYLFANDFRPFLQFLFDEGYEFVYDKPAGRTFLMDVSSPLEALKNDLHKKWRRHLKHSESGSLSIVEGTGDGLFEVLIQIYNEMIERKGFKRPSDINQFREIQKRLPPELKMRILICFSAGSPAAGALCCTNGNTGMNIYRATNDLGRKTEASYLLQWRIIEWVKENNCLYYNVNGISPERNPGTYSFKLGLCGNRRMDLYYLGLFDSFNGNIRMKILYRYFRKIRYNIKMISKTVFRR